MTGSDDNPRKGKRLDTWKQIGGFFGRDERTVKRWETTRGVPVHRVPGGGRANVYAYEGELTEWLKSNDGKADADGDGHLPTQGTDEPASIDVPPGAGQNDRAKVTQGFLFGNRLVGRTGLFLALAVIVAAGAGVLTYRSRQSAEHGGLGAAKAGSHQVDPEAEELYLKGIYYWHKRTPESLNQAVDYFTQSIVRDPNNAEAYVGLANCYNLLREYTTMPAQEAYPRAMAAAKRAIALDDSLSGAHSSLGFVEFYWSWDAAGAQKEFERALALDPKSVNAYHWYATVLLSLGRLTESLTNIEKAQELDPQSTPILADKALIIFHAGHADQAILQLKQLESSEPAFLSPHNYLAGIYFAERDYRNFLEESKQAATLKRDQQRLAIVAAGEKGWAASGAKGALKGILDLQKVLYAQGKEPAYGLAQTYASLGDKQEALNYLQTAYTKHEESVLAIRVEPAFKILYSENAFRKLLAQIGLPPVE